ncbi:damage-inducible type I toxin DinQ [Escherichia albertii]
MIDKAIIVLGALISLPKIGG